MSRTSATRPTCPKCGEQCCDVTVSLGLHQYYRCRNCKTNFWGKVKARQQATLGGKLSKLFEQFMKDCSFR